MEIALRVSWPPDSVFQHIIEIILCQSEIEAQYFQESIACIEHEDVEEQEEVPFQEERRQVFRP